MTPIPPFPDLRLLEIDDRSTIESLTAPYPPYSDFLFASLWAWNTDGTCAVSLLHGNLVVRLPDYTSDTHFYAFIGTNQVDRTVRTLLERAKDEGLLAEVRLVPEAAIAIAPELQRCLCVVEDRDSHDYVYAIADWVRLEGSAFRRHRQHISRCRPRCAFTLRTLDLGSAAVQTAMVALFRRWAEQKPGTAADEPERELTAIRRLFALAPDDRIEVCGIEDDGCLVAFAIWEGLPGGDFAVTHFAKADRSYEGLSTLLHHEQCRRMAERGYRLLNLEQDLGIPGLREYKRSLRPCGFLRKYVISEPSGAAR